MALAASSGIPDAASAALLADGVLPRIRKLPAEGWSGRLDTEPAYDPRTVEVARVTGGFNSVVQVAAGYCLRSYLARLDALDLTLRLNGIVLRAALDDLAGALADPWWRTFEPDPRLAYGFGLELEAQALAFSEPRMAAIRFQATLTLRVEVPQLAPPPAATPAPAGGIGPAPAGTDGPAFALEGIVPYLPGTIEVVGDPGSFDAPMRNLRTLGGLTVTLHAPYAATSLVPQRAVDVWLDMEAAAVDVVPDAGDTRVLYERFVAPRLARLQAMLAPVRRMALLPTVALAGRNPAGSPVAELAEFEARAFHVAAGTRQALCVAFDVVPGCSGIVEDVRHFIGRHDYGVIHDEYVVERVLHHKWNAGGFDRSLALANVVALSVRRDGEERIEDAWIYGRLVLDTLDQVALVPHADLRLDVLALGGRARAIPERLVLLDGTVLTPADADLGPVRDTAWAVDMAAGPGVVLSDDPELRAFQIQAHIDGVRHLARPFARFPEGGALLRIEYARTEAVRKRLFFLGRLDAVFF